MVDCGACYWCGVCDLRARAARIGVAEPTPSRRALRGHRPGHPRHRTLCDLRRSAGHPPRTCATRTRTCGRCSPPCPQIVVTDASVGDEDADQPRDGRGQFAESLVVAGLAGIFGRIASLTWGRT